MHTPRFWQFDRLASKALLPAAWAYGLGAWADRRLTTPKHAPLPVISIGNVTTGGAGKTPSTIALTHLLHAMGEAPHLLTRGYGGSAKSVMQVATTSDWHAVGDEALLLARHAPTWVSADRLEAAIAAQEAGASIALCDDALQHHRLYKDLSLLVIDGAYGLGNGRLLPAGPLREPLRAALARTDAVVWIGAENPALRTRIPCPVFTARITPTLAGKALAGKRFAAFAGIARPEKFYALARTHGAELVATRDFPDHYAYQSADVAALKAWAAQHEAQLLTTEKDAVKLPDLSEITVFPIALRFTAPAAVTQWLGERLSALRQA